MTEVFTGNMVDMAMANEVEIKITSHEDGFRVWVNVDGLCKFRAYRVDSIDCDFDQATLDAITGKEQAHGNG